MTSVSKIRGFEANKIIVYICYLFPILYSFILQGNLLQVTKISNYIFFNIWNIVSLIIRVTKYYINFYFFFQMIIITVLKSLINMKLFSKNLINSLKNFIILKLCFLKYTLSFIIKLLPCHVTLPWCYRMGISPKRRWGGEIYGEFISNTLDSLFHAQTALSSISVQQLI